MVSLLKIIAAVVCSLASCAQARHIHHAFNIAFERFNKKDCSSEALDWSDRHGDRDPPIIHQEKCHHWKDDKTFKSFSYDWWMRTSWSKMHQDRDCALLVYEKDHCEGRLFWVKDHISTPEGIQAGCYYLEGLKARSAKVTCRPKGEAPYWQSETHWKEPIVVPDSDVET